MDQEYRNDLSFLYELQWSTTTATTATNVTPPEASGVRPPSLSQPTPSSLTSHGRPGHDNHRHGHDHDHHDLHLRSIKMYPIRIERMRVERLSAAQADTRWLLARMTALCRELGTHVHQQLGPDNDETALVWEQEHEWEEEETAVGM